MPGAPDLTWQGSLFDDSEPAGERLGFAALRRDPLDDRSWVDVVPGWVPDHGELFDWLRERAPWRQRTRTMWDRDVLEPRLVAAWGTGEPLPPPVRELVEPLSARYGVDFDSCLVNLYRDGSDAVAWHGDTVRKVLRDPLVATVSLGARRSFLLRPAAGGPVTRRYAPGEGDLLVMGGSCQHDWVHTVPRERTASGARMSVTLRHSRPASGRARVGRVEPTDRPATGATVTEPDGKTPSAPDVDQPEGGAHTGEADTARGDAAPDVDQPEGGAHSGDQ